MPEVALVSAAKSGEPLGAWILCNTRGWAVSGKEIKHRAIDSKHRPQSCCDRQSQEQEESTLTSFGSKISTEDNFISSQVRKQHVLLKSVGWISGLQRVRIHTNSNNNTVRFWLKGNCSAAADNDEVDGDTPKMLRGDVVSHAC